MLRKLVWGLVALLGASALAVAVGWIRPQEKVNALWLIVAAACLYALAYRFYALWIGAKVLALDPGRPTPAVRLKDGMDYDPTHRWVLFGHHFAAIAGAGPLIGPMLAAQFGYLPGFLWILVGAVAGGAVHDLVILAASVRRDGKSLAQIARMEIGPWGGLAASVAILFIILVALAGLGLAVVNALTHSPWGTYTIALTIPIALGMGVYLKYLRPGKVWEVTVLGVALLLFAVVSGQWIAGTPLAGWFDLSRNQLILALMLYGLLASVLPIWLLLCPRDYLSTYMKLGTISILAGSLLLLAPRLQMPPVTAFVHGNGPVIPGRVFPFMFITIACGAISGFHALIASGTTPKMIVSERDVPLIGYGAMLAEGFVGLIALIAAAILIPGDYFAINTRLTFDQLAALGFPVARIAELSRMVGVNVAGRPGGAVSLAVGMASLLGSVPGLRGLMPYWYNFALMFEALFILTTVDAGTRVARFLLQEFAAKVAAPLARPAGRLPGILGSGLLVVGAWGYLIYSGNVASIWPMFGVANQLLASLALGLGTTLLLREGKKNYMAITLAPMLFMLCVTLTAAWDLFQLFNRQSVLARSDSEAWVFRINAWLVLGMAGLAVLAAADMVRCWRGLWKETPRRAAARAEFALEQEG